MSHDISHDRFTDCVTHFLQVLGEVNLAEKNKIKNEIRKEQQLPDQKSWQYYLQSQETRLMSPLTHW